MPSLEEIKQMARERKRIAESQPGNSPADAPATDESADPKEMEAARAVVEETLGKDPTGLGDAMRKGFADTARVSTGLVMDPARAAIRSVTPGNENTFRYNLALERAKTRMIQAGMPPLAQVVAPIAGETAMMAAMPGAGLVNTPMKAVGAGAALGAADTARVSLEETGELPTGQEATLGALRGAAGAGIGVAIGGVGEIVMDKIFSSGRSLSTRALQRVKRSADLTKQGNSALVKANVTLTENALQSLAVLVDKRLIKEGIRGGKAWDALNGFRQRMLFGGEMSLQELNKLRTKVRDTPVGNESRAGLKIATDTMNQFIGTLRGRPHSVASGDVAGGVAAWNMLNRSHIRAEKANEFYGMFLRAEDSAAVTGRAWFHEMQDQARKVIEDPGVRKLFNEQDIKDLTQIAKGTNVQRALNRLDRAIGAGGISRIFASTLMAPSKAIVNRTSAIRARDAMNSILGENVNRRAMLSPLAGIAAANQLNEPQVAPQAPAAQQQPPGVPYALQGQFPPQATRPGSPSPNVSPDPLSTVNPPRRP